MHQDENFKGLFLNGYPIKEQIYSYGPFVMNNEKEIENLLAILNPVKWAEYNQKLFNFETNKLIWYNI